MKSICVVCGNAFESKTNRAKYCSSKCKNSSRWEKTLGQIREENTEKQQKVVELYYSDLTAKEIAKQIGKTTTFVYDTWRNAGLTRRLTPLQKQVKELRLKGLCCSEIVDELGIKAKQVSTVSESIGLPFTEAEKEKSIRLGYEKSRKTITKKDNEVARFIEERIPGFKYAGNYTGCDGSADIRCLKCGSVITRSMITIRKRNVRCQTCYQLDKAVSDAMRLGLKLSQDAEKKKKKEEEQKQRFWDRSFEQQKMKECPICHTIFLGNRKYCSDKCAHQNRWHMKDGYRKLFPLDEVYQRDNGICYLCGQPCDWNDFVLKDGVIIYGNKYPSRDHVIPKSAGGRNDWENIKLAHRGCNAKKHIAPWS